MTLRIGEAIETLRRRHPEAQHHRLARRGRQPVLRRFAVQVRAISVGNDQPGIAGEYIARQIAREGEEQAIAMRPIVLPLPVRTQIVGRGFDLDDPDLPARVDGYQIGTASRRQRQFAETGKPKRS